MGCESTAFEAAEGESGVDGSAQHGIGLLTKPCSGYILWLETDTVLDKCIKTECSEKEQKDDEYLVPIQCHSRQDGHRPSNHCIETATRPRAQLKTATPEPSLPWQWRVDDRMLGGHRAERSGYAGCCDT